MPGMEDGADLASTADQIMSILDAADDADEGAEPADTSDPNPAQPDGDEPAEGGEGEGADDGAEPADDEPAETDPEEEPADTETFTVTVDGKEEKVTREELLKGYSRHADYSRKMNALAEDRKALDAARAEAQTNFQAEVARLAQLTQLVMAADPVLADAAQTDWQKLAQTDHEEYSRRKAAVEGRMMALQAVAQEQQAVAGAQRGKALQQQKAALVAAIPDLGDPAKAAPIVADLRGYLSEVGMSPGEIASIADARFLRMAYDAMQGKKAAAAKAALASKRVTPTPTKTVKPNSAARGAKQRITRSQLDGRSLSEQADLISSLL